MRVFVTTKLCKNNNYKFHTATKEDPIHVLFGNFQLEDLCPFSSAALQKNLPIFLDLILFILNNQHKIPAVTKNMYSHNEGNNGFATIHVSHLF